jgi:hypothetical protein
VDTIKTRLQTHHEYTPIISDQEQPPKRLLSFASLYRGIGITLLFSVPALSLYLTTYEWCKQWLLFLPIPLLIHAIAGCFAELAAGLFFTPMEVIKSQLQIDPLQVHSTWSLSRTILHQDGPLGFYRGYWITIAVFLPHTVVYFVIYEQLKANFTDPGFWEFMVCSAIASALGIMASTPLDIIKTRWQVSAQQVEYQVGPLRIAKMMWENEGQWRAFTQGMLVRIAWGVPVTTINMAVFEQLIKMHNNQ